MPVLARRWNFPPKVKASIVFFSFLHKFDSLPSKLSVSLMFVSLSNSLSVNPLDSHFAAVCGNLSFTILYNMYYMCGSACTLSSDVWSSHLRVNVLACERIWEKKRARYWKCVCIVCLLLSLLIRLAVWPKPEILVTPFWLNTRDLSAAGKPGEIWGSWVWLGIPPQTYYPSLGSEQGVCVCVCMHL